MKTVDVLRAAKEKILDQSNWTKGHIYGYRANKDASASHVNNLSEANCFCSIGACAAAVGLPKSNLVTNPGKVRTHDTDFVDGKYLRGEELLKYLWPEANKLQIGAMERAARYLNAAAREVVKSDTKLSRLKLGYDLEYAYEVNDEGGHDVAMKVFDLAIKNAKRRHINGGRTKAVSK